ncbi:jg16889 [Pararge aegeria aegeria]|uniref:Jg16889 protein n=1 Tax=Pararge aegeria aegeria TaxID=348720 RepID=A0A8S4SGD9_9NEOP|nr:jg16889 [Pararge aegeria aegeria]
MPVTLGALFASKGHQVHQSHGWTPHQKEIHLHIHNNGYQGHGTEHETIIPPWSRDGGQTQAESKHVNVGYDPYAAGPQTISTPYGNYVKIDTGHLTQHTA